MKPIFRPAALLTVILALLLPVSAALAQANKSTAAPAEVLDENTRLMQEYMMRRQEWIVFRQAALDQIKEAKTDTEGKHLKEKLVQDEKPLKVKFAEAARAYKAAEKAKFDQLAATKPSN